MGCLKSLLFGTVTSLFLTTPIQAAETIIFPVGQVEVSISVNELAAYAESNQLNPSSPLATYLQFLSEPEKSKIRALLQSQYTFNPLAVDRLLRSPMVAAFLTDLGRIIQTESSENGAEAIRTAIVQASTQDRGISIIESLRQFPGSSLRINLNQAINLLAEVATLIQQTDSMVTIIENLSRTGITTTDTSHLTATEDLRDSGIFTFKKQTLWLNDFRRQRQFEVDLYLPTISDSTPESIPVIVISHGLASHRSRFASIAQHLASYGFAVVVPQHPGSDEQQLHYLFKGDTSELFEAQQFIDRPLDITYTLNRLEELNQTEFNETLNLNQVGILGHSLGGYTALVLAGATLNFQQLQADCLQQRNPINISLFLQCRALELPKKFYDLKDSRIQSLVLLNPINSSLFGKSGLSQVKIPVMLIASSRDILAPALLEQIQSFTWLTTPQHYLVLKRGDHHFYEMGHPDSKNPNLPSLHQLISVKQPITRDYVHALSVAFFKTYIAEEKDYQSYLHPTYGSQITVAPFTLSILTQKSQASLATHLENLLTQPAISKLLQQLTLS